MTDYLEELLDNTEALLEQVRRLERSGARPALEEAEGGISSSAFRSAQGAMEERGAVRKLKTGETLRTLEAQNESERDVPDTGTGGGGTEDRTLEPPERIPTPLEVEERTEEGSVLLEQLERLERAAAAEIGDSAADRSAVWGEDGSRRRTVFPASPAGARGEAIYPGVTGTAGNNWTLVAGFAGTDVQPSEELRWAEQADRVFRRDSRRYDGDFYLY